MNGNERSTVQDFDPDTAPDLSVDGWPEKFAQATVRRGRPPVTNPKVVHHHPSLAGRDRSL